MNAQQAQASFQQADALFRQGRFGDAFRVLAELNQAFPNSKNVLYPMALCLEKLGQPGEALKVCHFLLEQFQDTRAEAIKARIEAASAPQAPMFQVPGMDALQFDLNDNQPSAFSAPPRPQAAPRGGNRTRVIGAAVGAILVLAGVVAAGMNQGWFSRGPSKFDQLAGRIAETLSPATSFSAALDLAINSSKVPMPIKAGGTIEYLEKDGALHLRLEGSSAVPPATLLLVATGSTMFVQVDGLGQKMVMKMPMTPDMTAQADPATLFSRLKDAFEVASLPDEEVRGKTVWVFDLKPKPEVIAAQGAPVPVEDLARMKLWVEAGDMSYVKIEALDAQGTAVMSYALVDLRLNPPLSAERFAYTPPEGVQVMDMSQMGGMMPFMRR